MPVRRDPPPTEEGWYVLHDFRTIDWDAWRETPQRERNRILDEAVGHLQERLAVTDAEEGESALYSMLGHKADILILHLRPTSAHLGALERQFEATKFAKFTERVDSFVSVTEASGYSERAREYFDGELDENSGLANYIQTRLHPTIPDATHVCFYPMDKRRGPDQNWYDLSFEERAEHMEAHGEIGRDYGGKVVQMITGAIAIDDWEWGVTLWGDDLTDMKDLLYEMRFDPSTSQFADFGQFYVGRRFPPTDLPALLAGEPVPTDSEHAKDISARMQSAGGTQASSAHGQDSSSNGHSQQHANTASSTAASETTASSTAADETAASSHATDKTAANQHGETAPAHDGETHTESHDGETHTESHDGETHTESHDGATTPPAHDTDKADHEQATTTPDRDTEGAEQETPAHPGQGSDDEAGPPIPDTNDQESWQEDDDIKSRLTIMGFQPGEDYSDGDYGLVLYSNADAKKLNSEVDDLRENFDHYDSHVTTVVRAHSGRTAVISIWDSERAATTAHGFLTDLSRVGSGFGGELSAPTATDSTEQQASQTGGDSGDEIREQLAKEDVYAGQPHGEDVYALVLYSRADLDTLQSEAEELSDGFDRYDTHEGTAVYDDPNSDTAAVVSLWETADAADTASDYLLDLPDVVGWADDTDGFATLGMFYTVKSEHREDFVEKFETVGSMLDEMDGHRETALLVHTEDKNDMFIASRWDSKDDAMGFFRSDDFAQTVDWGRDVLADRPRHVFLA